MKITPTTLLLILASAISSIISADEIQSTVINKQDAPVLIQQCSRGFNGKFEGS